MITDGTVKWTRQIGSSGDDRVARGGGRWTKPEPGDADSSYYQQ